MPSFSKILRPTDVQKQMAVSNDFMPHLPASRSGGTVNLPVIDVSSGTTWQFGYYTRRNRHPRPVFQGGWHKYLQHKGLTVGDKITFSADGGNYSIQAERKLHVMGREIWTRDF